MSRSQTPSQLHHVAHARDIKPIRGFNAENYEALEEIGIHYDARQLAQMSNFHSHGVAMDSVQPTVTQGSIEVPIQFLQTWLPGHVVVLTAARKIDELIGVDTIGSFEDEEIVQPLLELTGYAQPYSDYGNVPFASWNANYVHFTTFRSEQGINVGKLEQMRTAKVRLDTASTKRQSATLALEVSRNLIGHFGVNAGANLTFGFLNTPGLPSYVTVPNGASGFPEWFTKDLLEIIHDLQLAFVELQNNSLDNFDPIENETTLAVATNAVGYLSTPSNLGYSVMKWLNDTYPKCRVVSDPRLNDANGGAGVFYLYADRIDDGLSTDGGKAFSQMVQTKFMTLGVELKAKSYIEDYANSTAGVMCKRPYLVVRFSGIS